MSIFTAGNFKIVTLDYYGLPFIELRIGKGESSVEITERQTMFCKPFVVPLHTIKFKIENYLLHKMIKEVNSALDLFNSLDEENPSPPSQCNCNLPHS